MKIVNKTHWDTRSLAAFFRKGLLSNGAWTNRTIEVVYGRRHSGIATVGGHWMRLRIPKKYVDTTILALVFEHELAHNLGVSHAEMDGDTRYCRVNEAGAPPAWSLGMSIAAKAAPPPVDHVAAREEKARKMLAAWERKLSLAKTKRGVWAKKVAYYDRKKAAGGVR